MFKNFLLLISTLVSTSTAFATINCGVSNLDTSDFTIIESSDGLNYETLFDGTEFKATFTPEGNFELMIRKQPDFVVKSVGSFTSGSENEATLFARTSPEGAQYMLGCGKAE